MSGNGSSERSIEQIAALELVALEALANGRGRLAVASGGGRPGAGAGVMQERFLLANEPSSARDPALRARRGPCSCDGLI